MYKNPPKYQQDRMITSNIGDRKITMSAHWYILLNLMDRDRYVRLENLAPIFERSTSTIYSWIRTLARRYNMVIRNENGCFTIVDWGDLRDFHELIIIKGFNLIKGNDENYGCQESSQPVS